MQCSHSLSRCYLNLKNDTIREIIYRHSERFLLFLSHSRILYILFFFPPISVANHHVHAKDLPHSATESILIHTKWIEECSHYPATVIRNNLIVYVADKKFNINETIGCLSIKRVNYLERNTPFFPKIAIYHSPIDKAFYSGDGSGSTVYMKEALVELEAQIIIISGNESDSGVQRVFEYKNNQLVVQTGYSNHSRNYILNLEHMKISYLTDGDVVATGLDRFKAHGKKSYFNGGGAFWFDAIVNERGDILEISTDKTGNECMPLHQLRKISNLALEHVSQKIVCIEDR